MGTKYQTQRIRIGVIAENSTLINGGRAPEVLLCLCGKHGGCTPEIFLATRKQAFNTVGKQ